MKKEFNKKRLIILSVICAVALIGAFIFFYLHPTVDPRYAIDCSYFERVADIHWAEAKVYSDLEQDAVTKGDINGSLTLGREQFQKQTLAEQWESQYEQCKQGN